MRIKRLVLCVGELEPLNYFSRQIEMAAKDAGLETYVINTKYPETYRGRALDDFCSRGDCIAVFFNQIGIMLSADSGENYWDSMDIPVYTMQVDHPRNFADALRDPIKQLHVLSIDKKHIDFIRSFFPKVENVYFLPQGGAPESDRDSLKKISDRPIEILYTGSCHQAIEAFPPIGGLPSNGMDMYDFAISLMLADPLYTTEEAIELYFMSKGYTLPRDQLLSLYTSVSIYVESYVRREWKFKTMEALDKAGFHVEIYGDHWKASDHPLSDNIVIHDRISSAECNRLMGLSRFTLNFIPWFKDGTSERPFNSMLNGSVCLIDKSKYLTERFIDGRELIFFDLTAPDELVSKLKDYMNSPEKLQLIADAGYNTAYSNDTWKNRLERILEFEN
ncbi:MAG: glycosyltransferase family 1 protein [Lachnospiraceae bacterium]|nr:glycosyltransferase family 1 protein [Lachnospiraceae bacterium]